METAGQHRQRRAGVGRGVRRLDDLQQGVVAEARAALSAAGYTFAEPADELEYNPAHAAISVGGSFVPGQFSTWQSFARGCPARSTSSTARSSCSAGCTACPLRSTPPSRSCSGVPPQPKSHRECGLPPRCSNSPVTLAPPSGRRTSGRPRSEPDHDSESRSAPPGLARTGRYRTTRDADRARAPAKRRPSTGVSPIGWPRTPTGSSFSTTGRTAQGGAPAAQRGVPSRAAGAGRFRRGARGRSGSLGTTRPTWTP